MENPRTTSARDHDDSMTIDESERGTSQGGRAGGTLAADVATVDELGHVRDPESHHRVTTSADIEHDQEQRPDRARAADAPGERVDDRGPATVGDSEE